MDRHNILGREGENAAADYLTSVGYEIRHRNWRIGHLEIDIVAEKDDTLAIVEVKTRSNTEFGEPEEAVNYAKIRKIVRAADAYVKKFKIDKQLRFDIIAVVGDGNSKFKIDHIKEAFYPPMFCI